MSPVNCGVGLPDDTPINPKPGRSTDTSPRQETQGCSVFGSAGTRVRAACSPFTGWPAPPSNAISKSKGPQIPMTRATPNTSRSATTLSGASAGVVGKPHRSPPPYEELERIQSVVRLPPRARNKCTGRIGLSRMKGNFQVRFLEGGGWQQPASTRRLSPHQFTPMSGAHPAHALDGGIPPLFHTAHYRPAASDVHRYAE